MYQSKVYSCMGIVTVFTQYEMNIILANVLTQLKLCVITASV